MARRDNQPYYAPIPAADISDDSEDDEAGDNEEYIENENLSGEDEGDNEDVTSETEGEVTEGEEEDEYQPIVWTKGKSSAWVIPKEAKIEKEPIQLEAEFSDKISRTTEPFEIL